MGGKKATSTSQVTIPPEVMARYNAVNTRAEAAANKPYESFGSNPADYVAQMNEQQALGTSTVNRSGGPAYAGIDNYMTPYIKNVADTTGAYMRQQQEQAQSGALGTAASSGAFGGDRAGIAAANLQQQNQMAYGKTMADIMNQGYTQALGASQADLNRGLQAGQTQLAAGTMQQQTEQAGKDAMINDFMQKKGYDFQTAQYLANIAMGTGALSGSTTTSAAPLNIFGQRYESGGRVEGYADGGGVAGPMSHIEKGIGGLGYVPEGSLPVGQLMVSEPPGPPEKSGDGDIMTKIFTTMAGAKNGGAIDARHGYATDGYVRPTGLVPELLNVTESGLSDDFRDGPRAAIPIRSGIAPVVSVRPQPRPEGLSGGIAPAASVRPQPRPANLMGLSGGEDAATAPKAPTGVVATNNSPSWMTDSQKIRQRESGNDYNALYNFSNRDGGQFNNVNLTDMTVDQAIEFSKLGGEYADYSKGQLGYTATPMGAYQIVGRTLRGLKDALGLSGNEKMTPELQDQLAKHLYDTQGMTPWAASEGNTGLSLSTRGSGGNDGLAGGAGADDLSGTYDGGVSGSKPYKDRNFIGKFFYNPDGTMNRDALMSTLQGLGAMASSTSASPIMGVLQGLGAGTETYKGLLKQNAEVTGKNIENANAFQTSYMQAQELQGFNGTQQEYAKAINYTGPIGTGQNQAEVYLGVPLSPFGTALDQVLTREDGTQVMAYNDLGYLQRLLAKQQPLLNAGRLPESAVLETQNRIKAIRDAGGMVPIEGRSGEYTIDPLIDQEQAQKVMTVRGDQLVTEYPVLKAAADEKRTTVNNLVKQFDAANQTGNTGLLSEIFRFGSAANEQLFGGSGAYAAISDEVAKSLAGFVISKGGSEENPTDLSRTIKSGSYPDLAKQPAANAWILATMQAQSDLENGRVAAIGSNSNPSMAARAEKEFVDGFDINAATQKYYQENLQKFGIQDPATIILQEAAAAPQEQGTVQENSLANNGDGTYGVYKNGRWLGIDKEEYERLGGQ